jgi:hypothetical protein
MERKQDIRLVWNSGLADYEEPFRYQYMALGRIPLAWLEAAFRIPSRFVIPVAMSLWWLKAMTKKNEVMLATDALKPWGMNAASKRRALMDLENAGLITVDRRRGRFPIITILEGDHLCADEFPSPLTAD